MPGRRTGRPGIIAALCTVAALLLCAAPAAADTFTVSNGNDAGAGSLRQAITDAEGNANGPVVDQVQITFTGNIDLDSDLPSLTTPMTISGTGANNVNVRRDPTELPANQFRMFAVSPAVGETVTIQDLTISGTRATGFAGGGISKGDAGTLILESVVLTDNDSASGGAIHYSRGFVSIRNSTLSGNRAAFGGAIVGTTSGGGNPAGVAEVINSTITGNSSLEFGGAIYVSNTASITIASSTITGNTANSDNNTSGNGGGIYNNASTVNIANTILAGNAVGAGAPGSDGQCGGSAYTSSGYNLRTAVDPGCTGFTGPGEVVDANPMLGTLGDNGGPTPTIPLLEGSPAINTGNPATPADNAYPACPTEDQRTAPRTVCDIGAFEFLNPTTITVACIPTSLTLGAGSSTCTATVTDTAGSPTTPTLSVDFTTNGAGTFSSPGSCTLILVVPGQASCQVTYTPTGVGSGSHQITGAYGGDLSHEPSQGSALVSVHSPPGVTPPGTTPPFNPAAAIRKCKKRFPKGPKRKKCIKRAKQRAQG